MLGISLEIPSISNSPCEKQNFLFEIPGGFPSKYLVFHWEYQLFQKWIPVISKIHDNLILKKTNGQTTQSQSWLNETLCRLERVGNVCEIYRKLFFCSTYHITFPHMLSCKELSFFSQYEYISKTFNAKQFNLISF